MIDVCLLADGCSSEWIPWSLTIPEERTLLRYSRKASSLISWSVKMKVIPLPWAPAVRYRYFRSSSRLDTLYDLSINKTRISFSENSNPFKTAKFSSRINEHYESEHGFDDPIYESHTIILKFMTTLIFIFSCFIIYSSYQPYFSFYSYHVNGTINIMQWIVDCGLSLSFNIILLVEYNTFWFYTKWILPFLLYFTSSTGRGWENTQKKSAIQVIYIN